MTVSCRVGGAENAGLESDATTPQHTIHSHISFSERSATNLEGHGSATVSTLCWTTSSSNHSHRRALHWAINDIHSFISFYKRHDKTKQ